MTVQEMTFASDGIRLRGAVYASETSDASLPVVLACSGFQGLRNIHPERLARALVPRGHTLFGFDYRGFAPSEGEKGRVILDEQIRDIAAAVRVIAQQFPDRPIALVGWGMAGGLVLEATRLVDGVRGVACLNGFYDAVRVQRTVRGEDAWQRFLGELRPMQTAATESDQLSWVDPFFVYPLDPVTQRYVDDVLRRDPAFGPPVWLPFADSLLAFAVAGRLRHLSTTPLLVVHGRDNALHPPDEARALIDEYPGPKELLWLEGAGHTEWMLDDHPTFGTMIDALDRWLRAL